MISVKCIIWCLRIYTCVYHKPLCKTNSGEPVGISLDTFIIGIISAIAVTASVCCICVFIAYLLGLMTTCIKRYVDKIVSTQIDGFKRHRSPIDNV